MLYNELKQGDVIATQADYAYESMMFEDNSTRMRPLRSYYLIKEVRDNNLSVVKVRYGWKQQKGGTYRKGTTIERTRYLMDRDCMRREKLPILLVKDWINDAMGWNSETVEVNC